MSPTIAYFISPHGFGHAARASAVMSAIAQIAPPVKFEIFTRVPRWFFQQSVRANFSYHPIETDVGLVQKDALQEDIPATLEQLRRFYPFSKPYLDLLTNALQSMNCNLVICDIAPVGIAAAKKAKIPSILIENFTWDWIYQGYLNKYPDLQKYITFLEKAFAKANYHIQTEPNCRPQKAHLTVGPISRAVRTAPAETRNALNLSSSANVVMLTMGGASWNYKFLDQLKQHKDFNFIIPGPARQPLREDNLALLPHQSQFFHPDLINASDTVIGKVGYSTLAEVYQAGVPYGYVPRQHFQESGVLAAYVEANMPGKAIAGDAFSAGTWLDALPQLLALPRRSPPADDSAQKVARFALDAILA